MQATANLARTVGWALQPIRPGRQAFATRRRAFAAVPEAIKVSSPAFIEAGPIPARYTVDGESLFPPIAWEKLPAGTESLALLVEDADAPVLRPLVHAIVVNIPPGLAGLREGAIPASMRGPDAIGYAPGRNSLGRRGWMPVAPPRGHGPHRYAFQLFALDKVLPLADHPGRNALLAAMRGHILARGVMVAVYSRD
jgi:Raf kinase inhibitor-like YbhB/YbcL family protein